MRSHPAIAPLEKAHIQYKGGVNDGKAMRSKFLSGRRGFANKERQIFIYVEDHRY